MGPETIRVSLRLDKTADKDAVLAAVEERLGRVPELVWRFREAPVLILRLLPGELETVRRIPGVAAAEREREHPLPPRPGKTLSDR